MNENDCLNSGILNLCQKRAAKNQRSKQKRESLSPILDLPL